MKQVFDLDTGEILKEPPFVKLYYKSLAHANGLSLVQIKMFLFMIENMTYENIVSYGTTAKKNFIAESGVKNSTFDNNISKMIKSELIQRIGRGEFRLNKKFVAKVDWNQVQRIDWLVSFDADKGKIETVNIQKKDVK